jgi:aryl-alcohol dehydrogenase
MSSQSRAAVLSETGGSFQLHELSLDEPRPAEVQVRMVATGVCHTDAVVRDGWIPTTFPIVLGHEGAGVVEKVGEGVSHLSPGDHVVLTVASCGQCASCWSGEPAYCEHSYVQNFAGGRGDGTSSLADLEGRPVTSHFFGQSSFATLANVAVRSVVKVRRDAPLELLGPLGCAIQTGAGAVLNQLQPDRDGTLVVFGAGAVGNAAILAGRVAGVERIVAVDVRPGRRDLARGCGATHTVDGLSEDVVAQIVDISEGGSQYAVDTTGLPVAIERMIGSLGHRGHAILLGASKPDAEAKLPLASALARAIRISTVIEGSAVPQTFIPRLIDLYLAGNFPFDRLITTYPFAEIERAFADSESGVSVKPVLLFDR